MNTTLRKRMIMSLLGVALTGVSVAIFKTSAMGTDPFSCLVIGLWTVSGAPYSLVYLVITASLLGGVFLVQRSYIGIATVFNLLFIGIIVEKCMIVFEICFPHPSIPIRLILMAVAVILMCFASSLYFTASLGVSAYDAWALILADRQKKVPFKICRIGTDIICTAAGFFMGAVVGIGTLVTAFGMGPLIEFFNKTCAEPFLYGQFGSSHPS